MDVYRHEQIRNVIAATGEYDKTKFAENGLRNSVAGWQSSTLKAAGRRRMDDMTIHSTLPAWLTRASAMRANSTPPSALLAQYQNANVRKKNHIDMSMAVSLISSRSLEPCGECKQSGDLVDCEAHHVQHYISRKPGSQLGWGNGGSCPAP